MGRAAADASAGPILTSTILQASQNEVPGAGASSTAEDTGSCLSGGAQGCIAEAVSVRPSAANLATADIAFAPPGGALPVIGARAMDAVQWALLLVALILAGVALAARGARRDGLVYA